MTQSTTPAFPEVFSTGAGAIISTNWKDPLVEFTAGATHRFDHMSNDIEAEVAETILAGPQPADMSTLTIEWKPAY